MNHSKNLYAILHRAVNYDVTGIRHDKTAVAMTEPGSRYPNVRIVGKEIESLSDPLDETQRVIVIGLSDIVVDLL